MADSDCELSENRSLKAISNIFKHLIWAKVIPDCYLAWISENLKQRIWRLRVIPFTPIKCNSVVKSNGVVDVE